MTITATATLGSISVTATLGSTQTITTTNVMVKHYTSTAASTQTFADFVGYALVDMVVIIQGAGLMGQQSDLTATRKLITGWNSGTGVMTFSQTLAAGWDIAVIGTL